jgi:beta-galactosidase
MHWKHYFRTITLTGIFFLHCLSGYSQPKERRTVQSLNGIWKLAQSESFASIPKVFNYTVKVPGLVDLARPAIGTKAAFEQKDKVFWYKASFKTANDAALVKLKIYKSMYHTVVYINGKLAGENQYSFTPTILPIKSLLKPKGKVNELMIGVGTIGMLADSVTDGKDVEKVTYIPGIYDNVEIISSDYPHIAEIQVAPQPTDTSIRVQARLLFPSLPKKGSLRYVVRELVTGKMVSTGSQAYVGELADFSVKLPGAKLWSPEQPFLYTLQLETDGDKAVTRFGIRSFEFKKGYAHAFLNNKPYYLRGTNVTIMRFFEDSARKQLPWNDQWITKLHRGFKDMNWNAMRYCIGFPPERWYEVADSLGLLIQDEYPVWQLKPNIKAKHLAAEYTTWIKERWNHPSVVIWDAQNETITKETGEAIQLVRHLDLSNRPWDNGFAPPQSDTDPIESHPYLFMRYMFGERPSSAGPLQDMLSGVKLPTNDPNEWMPSPDGKYYDNPIIINEYSWLWLNRDGSPTTLTDTVYKTMFGNGLTTAKKFELYARHVAALTEYWRSHRTSAAVMHFCSLGYSRTNTPRGQTSDHLINIEKLENEPHFIKYVKPSFAPVGVMIDAWASKYSPGQEVTIPIQLVNDTDSSFSADLYFEILQQNKVVLSKKLRVNVDKYGRLRSLFRVQMPIPKGSYELNAYYVSGAARIFSVRQIEIDSRQ